MRTIRLIILGAIVVSTAMASFFPSTDSEDAACRMRISPYRHAIEWPDGSTLEIKAEVACASRLGRPFELSDVTLALSWQDQPKITMQSTSALLTWDEKRVIFGSQTKIVAENNLYHLPGVVADWNSREVRAVSGFYYNWSFPKTAKPILVRRTQTVKKYQ